MRYERHEMQDTVLLTHNDLDGAGCAVVFLLAGGRRENVHYLPAGNGVRDFVRENKDVLSSARHVIIADLSTKENDGETPDTLEKMGNVVLLDHHKTATFLNERKWCIVETDRCGTMLLYEFLFIREHEEIAWIDDLWKFVMLVNDWDMWIHNDPTSDQLNLFADFWGQEKFVNMMEYRIRSCYPLLEVCDDKLIARLETKRDEFIEKVIDEPIIREIDGLKFAYIFIDNHQSMALNRLLEKTGCDVAVGVCLGNGTVSLRTMGVDGSKIAMEHGGGGHARAAGWPIDKPTLLEILEVVHP